MLKRKEWRVKLLYFLIISVAVFSDVLVIKSAAAEDIPSEAEVDGILLQLSTDQAKYGEEDPVSVSLEVENHGEYRLIGANVLWRMTKGMSDIDDGLLPRSVDGLEPGESYVLSGILAGDPQVFGKEVPTWFVLLILFLDFALIAASVASLAVIKKRGKKRSGPAGILHLLMILSISSILVISSVAKGYALAAATESEGTVQDERIAETETRETEARMPAVTESTTKAATIVEKSVTLMVTFQYAGEEIHLRTLVILTIEQ